MNVYFIDPKYVKSKAWEPLLKCLKVNTAYSFIPREQLPEELISIIHPYLTASYSNQDIVSYSNNCAYWLRAHFEMHINLVSKDFKDVNDVCDFKKVPLHEWRKYNTNSAYNNIVNRGVENALVILSLNSGIDWRGNIEYPKCNVDVLQEQNLPTHIAKYCLNILHKKFKHSMYQAQSAFVMFNEYLTSAYRYMPVSKRWDLCIVKLNNGHQFNLMKPIIKEVHKISPNDFPTEIKNGKPFLRYIHTDEGAKAYKEFIEEARNTKEDYYNSVSDNGDSDESEVEAWGADVELKYIRSNGGDWIDD